MDLPYRRHCWYYRRAVVVSCGQAQACRDPSVRIRRSRQWHRFFFSTLGLQAIGFSPFGMDYTRSPDASKRPEEFLEPLEWRSNGLGA